MRLNIEKKQQVVSKISEIMERSVSGIVASLEGITANEITNLRSICRKNNIYVYVVRNTLMYRAINSGLFKCLQHLFTGSNIIGFSTLEARDCIKVFVEFSKKNKKFKLKGAMYDGVFVEESKIYLLSSLPSYKDCILNLMFIMRESTLGRLILLLKELCNN